MSVIETAASPDLSTCDREPIHIPGSIQSRGVLLATEDESTRISHASVNTRLVSAFEPRKLVGAELASVLGEPAFAALQAALSRQEGDHVIPVRLFAVKLKGKRQGFDVTVHRHDGRTLVEIEPSREAAFVAPLELVQMMLGKLQQSRSLHDLCHVTVEELRQLIGYDRVMIYRFLQDGSGQVISESKAPDLESLLDLRYPASDIPRQARELYKKNWVRLISDVHSEVVPIAAHPQAGQRPLDLSFADLRSVSPVHVEYLKNMGVGASMSISIIVGGELWGLIACHHRTARNVPGNLRAAAELLGQVFSLQIQTVEGIEAYVTMRAARALLDRIVAEFPVDGNLIENLSARLDQLASFISCDGVGIYLDGSWRGMGATPTAGEAALLARHADGQRVQGVYATHALAEVFPPAHDWRCNVRGLLAVPLSHQSGDWLFFFRTEVAQAVRWGGDPSKPVIGNGASERISPRKSFESWKQEVRGQALPWTARERLIGDTLRVYLLDIIVRFSEVIMEERRHAEQRQRLLTSELNHRVKGTLELIQSLVVQGYEQEGRVQSFVRSLEGRIRAIALAHDAISVASGSELRNLVETSISQETRAHPQVHIQGPEILLEAKAYTVLALVIHEMTSLSVASGALSRADGRLSITWFIDPASRLVILWEERGRRTAGSARQGADALGLTIIRRNIPHALGGEAEIHFEDSGLKASFIVPQRYIVSRERLPDHREARVQISAPPSRPLDGYSVLLVEDQMLVAVELERMLRERGAVEVEIAGSTAQALESIAAAPPDVAVLDVDLGDETVFAVAEVLAGADIPFVLAANEADTALIPPQFRTVPLAAKPYSGDAVAELLKEALLPHLIRAVLTRLV